MKFALLITILFSVIYSQAQSLDLGKMEDTIQDIRSTFLIGYAPTDWKKKHINWDLDKEVSKAVAAASNKTDLSTYDFHKIVKSLFRSAQDYHVGVSFISTKRSTLPIMIKAAENENRYFIAYIDRKKLSKKSFPIEVGDEVLEFGGKPVQEEVDFLLSEVSSGVPLTDRTYASLLLTRRSAAGAMTVPSGPVEITIRKKGQLKNQSKTVQMIWEHTPEAIDLNPTPETSALPLDLMTAPNNLKGSVQSMADKKMILPGWAEADLGKEANNHQIGAKKSFIPNLGSQVWKSENGDNFYAYIYKSKTGKLIGYVRIPHYGGSTEKFLEFKKIIMKFSEVTDGLVIDQVNNPGGSVFYLYALTSVLTEKPLYAPKHYIKLKPDTVLEAIDFMDQMKKVTDDESAQKEFGKDWSGYLINYQVARYMLDYSKFIVNEWNKGKKLTSPTYLYSADKINPDLDANYSKPILILTNSLDFSGGDFFPAILQDNKRVTILGTRTAGAGGYIEQYSVPNSFGINSFSMTGSLALRINQQPIENLGVTPDIEYAITAKDLESNYVDYVKAIQTEINKLTK